MPWPRGRRAAEPGRDHQRVVAGCHERIVETAEHAGAGVVHGADLAVDHRGRAHHRARRRRRRSPGGRGRRRASARSAPSSRMRSTQIPASSGSAAPATSRSPRDPSARCSATESASLRSTATVAPELAQVLHEVEGERVVVVDDQHLTAQRRAHAFASSTARICAATLLSISTVSSCGRRVGDDAGGGLHVGDAVAGPRWCAARSRCRDRRRSRRSRSRRRTVREPRARARR